MVNLEILCDNDTDIFFSESQNFLAFNKKTRYWNRFYCGKNYDSKTCD